MLGRASNIKSDKNIAQKIGQIYWTKNRTNNPPQNLFVIADYFMNTTEYVRIVRHTHIYTLSRQFQSFSCDWPAAEICE